MSAVGGRGGYVAQRGQKMHTGKRFVRLSFAVVPFLSLQPQSKRLVSCLKIGPGANLRSS